MNTDIQTKTRTQKDRQQYNNTNREINTKNISTIQYRPTNKGKDKNKIYEQKFFLSFLIQNSKMRVFGGHQIFFYIIFFNF